MDAIKKIIDSMPLQELASLISYVELSGKKKFGYSLIYNYKFRSIAGINWACNTFGLTLEKIPLSRNGVDFIVKEFPVSEYKSCLSKEPWTSSEIQVDKSDIENKALGFDLLVAECYAVDCVYRVCMLGSSAQYKELILKKTEKFLKKRSQGSDTTEYSITLKELIKLPNVVVYRNNENITEKIKTIL